MTERFGARLKYEDELAAEMRQCEEQLELMYLKRKLRKQQKERDEEQRLTEEEERRARKAAKKEEERRVKRHETELKKIEEAIQRRETEYLEIKRLDSIKLQSMKEEMDKVGAELQKVMARRDSARKAREIKRQEALAKREDDEKFKENMQRQSDVKVETLNLKDQHIGFHKTSDELHKFQTPITIPHADDVEVPGICIAKSHSGIPSLETCSIPSASIPPHVATVKIVQSSIVLVEGIQTACRPEPCCDVTSTESAPSQLSVVPVLVLPANLALNDSLDLTVTDEVDLDDHQIEL